VDTKPNNNREEFFRKTDERLLGFYDSKPDSMSNEEEDSLLPILHSLDDVKDRYEELGPIAAGGEKVITRVYDHCLNRQIAMARAVSAKTQQDQEQFLREAQLVANLAHPFIVPILNIGKDTEKIPFFTMELIPGDGLNNIIQQLREGNETYKRDYPVNTLLNMFIKICDAIAYAHSRNVLHLDIKPDNIQVGGFGEVFICDWGLARVMFDDEPVQTESPDILDGDLLNDITLSGTIKGTPGFMAPEQAVTDGKKTFQTDIYALGALLYMLLSYKLPVQGDSGNELLKNTREGKIIALQIRKKDRILPNSLTAVAMKALSLKPENRYASVTELQQEISRYLAGFPTTAERAGIITSLSLLVKRHNRIAFIVMFFLLLMAAVISANLVAISKEKAEAVAAREQAVAAREQAENNFRLYREEQIESTKLGDELSDSTQYAIQTKDYSTAVKMLRVLEIALDKNPEPVERKELLLQKGTMHFVLQQFNQANHCFEEIGADTPTNGDDTWSLSKKYSERKPDDRKKLSLSQLTELISEANTPNRGISYMYFHHMKRTHSYSPEEYLPLAKVMLNRLNKVRGDQVETSLKLQKKEAGYHLDLTESSYMIFTLRGIGLNDHNILEPLNLYSLDISHLPLRSLSELGGLHLKELRMVGLNIGRRNVLPKQMERLGIERIIIDVDAYPPKIINILREKHEVIDEKSGAYSSQ
jgi:serine/threonine protein kinase